MHIEHVPDGEREEIRQIFLRKGFSGDALETAVDVITKDRRQWVDTMLMEELGLRLDPPRPLRAALITFASFLAAGLVPLVPLLLVAGHPFAASALATAGTFFAIGAFTTVMFVGQVGIPLILALPLGAFISAAFGFLLGLPALRLEGPYLAIATMGLGMAVTSIIKHTEFFGGRMGLQAPKLYLFDTALKDIHFYYIIAGIAVILVIAAIKLFKTKVGRAFIAIRDSDIAAETMGVNLSYYKTLAFAVSAFYTGIAGGLYAFILGFITIACARSTPVFAMGTGCPTSGCR